MRESVFLKERKTVHQLCGYIGFKDLSDAPFITIIVQNGTICILFFKKMIDDVVQSQRVKSNGIGIRRNGRNIL